jgi:S-formylglutathione hydrolase
VIHVIVERRPGSKVGVHTTSTSSRCHHLPLIICHLSVYISTSHLFDMPELEKVQSNKVASGTLTKYSFPSESLGGLKTNFNLFLPSEASSSSPAPVLIYLAGLTCNEDTGAQKGGFLLTAAKHGLAVVLPDTSPRGAGVEGEEDDWDLGTGAGFYLNATAEKWSKYRMYDLVVKELPEVLKKADLGLVSPTADRTRFC